jgi:hypothetical protein
MQARTSDVSIETVKSRSPQVLYKYRSWGCAEHKSLLSERVAWLAQTSKFLDDKDCRNLVRYDLATPQDLYNIHHRIAINKLGMKRVRAHQYATHKAKTNPFNDPHHLKWYQQDHFNDFDSRFGVLSVTANDKNLKMWNDYAAEHAGICVGISTQVLFDSRYVGGGGDVAYTDNLPIILPSDTDATQITKQIFFKETKWDYEEEYRIFKLWNHKIDDSYRKCVLPPEAFKEVIFGALMPDQHKDEVKEICAAQNLKVEFFPH